MNISVQLAPTHNTGLLVKNPVMTASGTFGYGTEYSPLFDIQKLGAIVCKGTTLLPREGNPQPRLKETASGILNSIGLQNIGVEALVREKAPIWALWQIPVIVNIAGERIDDYVNISSQLEGVVGINAIEMNIGCPNMAAGGMEFGTDPKVAAAVVSAVKKASSLPVIVKLTPNVTNITEIALAVEDAGAHALCLINTLLGMAIDVARRKPFLGNIRGGLSGPAIKPVALYAVYRVAEKVKIPVIGCGGISSAEDALEFIMAGASAVQVGTAQLTDPHALLKVIEGIEQFMHKEGIKDLSQLIGIARG